MTCIVIASEAKQSMPPQSGDRGLLRRYAPRNDEVGIVQEEPN